MIREKGNKKISRTAVSANENSFKIGPTIMKYLEKHTDKNVEIAFLFVHILHELKASLYYINRTR